MRQKSSSLNTEFQHGKWKSPAWNSWDHMKRRCNNPKDPKYKDYGARGIRVCERWMAFENFYADMGDRPDGCTLDRIDNNGNYEPANCKWSTPKEQSRNRRIRKSKEPSVIVNGQRVLLKPICEKTGLAVSTIRYRANAGWSIEEINQNKTHGNRFKNIKTERK